jgi:hypothetical protein
MKLLLAILMIAMISLLGSRLTFLDRRLPLGFRNILLTGIEYIFIGALLGKMGLSLLDDETIFALSPFLMFGLCWVGFLFGLQFEVKLLQKLPRFYFSITIIESLVTFIWVSTIVYFGLAIWLDFTGKTLLVAALVLGAAASCTAQSAIAIVSRSVTVTNKGLLGLLRYISSVDGLPALLFFSLALGLDAGITDGAFNVWQSIRWIGLSIAIGLLPAVILILLSRHKFSSQEYLVFLIGTVMFAAGIARELHHSPLVTGLVCGMIIANFCRHRLRAMDIVVHAERSIYIILLLLLGASWTFTPGLGLLVTVFYFTARLAGKTSGAFAALRLFKPQYPVPAWIGLGLISEGGLAIAILLDYRLHHPAVADVLTSIVIFSIIVSELMGPRLILAQLKTSQQTQPSEQ